MFESLIMIYDHDTTKDRNSRNSRGVDLYRFRCRAASKKRACTHELHSGRISRSRVSPAADIRSACARWKRMEHEREAEEKGEEEEEEEEVARSQ